jgi:hypothetical protein
MIDYQSWAVIVIGLVDVAGFLVLLVSTVFLVTAGLRAGDRPEDVTVTAAVAATAQPDGVLPVVVATARNPGASAVLVGLSVYRRRLPTWMTGGVTVTVPRRTLRGRSRLDRQAVLGVVDAGQVAQWRVPVPAGARRCRLVAAIGQRDGRLRLISLPVPPFPPYSPGSGARTPLTPAGPLLPDR